MVTLLPFLPESPRWLLNHDRIEYAQEAPRRFSGKDLSADDPIVQDQLKPILGAIEIERRSRISFEKIMLCRDRSGHLKCLLLDSGGQFMQMCLEMLSRSTLDLADGEFLATGWDQRSQLLLPNHP